MPSNRFAVSESPILLQSPMSPAPTNTAADAASERSARVAEDRGPEDSSTQVASAKHSRQVGATTRRRIAMVALALASRYRPGGSDAAQPFLAASRVLMATASR